jgi:hypothetical protein
MAGGAVTGAQLERAIDSAVAARRTSLPTLRSRLQQLEGRGRHGCVLLRELLLDSGGESYLERRFLTLMRNAGIARPRCQVAFTSSSGKPIRVDFLFGAVIVEVSGRLGHTSGQDRQHAGRRRFELEQQGYRFVEFTTADVIDDPEYVVRAVRSALAA